MVTSATGSDLWPMTWAADNNTFAAILHRRRSPHR
jgi:hypothetical protein